MNAKDPQAAPRKDSVILAMAWFCLVAGWVAAGLRWGQYQAMLPSQWIHERGMLKADPDPGRGDWVLLWLLCAQNLVFLLVPLATAALVVKMGWRKTGQVLFILLVTLLAVWLALDIKVQLITGNHVLHYLSFLDSQDVGQTVGPIGGIAWRVLAIVGICAAIATLGLLFARGLLREMGPWAQWPKTTAAVYILAVAGAAAAQLAWKRSERLQDLDALLPLSMTWLSPGAGITDAQPFMTPLAQVAQPALREVHERLFDGQDVDTALRIAPAPGRRLPNVLLVIVESLRYSALRPQTMPRVSAWAQAAGAMRLERHYSGANLTHFALFSLLYGRSAAFYYATLQRHVPPQMPLTLRASGYTAVYGSYAWGDWQKVQLFINDQTFDSIPIDHAPTNADWPQMDRQAMDNARRLLAAAQEHASRPLFVVVFLNSTHFPYRYPPEFETRRPVMEVDANSAYVLGMHESDRPKLLARYENSVSFVDAQIGRLVEKLDLSRNLVIITGDHGESLWEDGTLSHGGSNSQIKMHVPCLIAGPGVPARRVDEFTTHADLLPTLFHALAGRHIDIAHGYGNDILADGFHSDHVLMSVDASQAAGVMLMLVGDEGGLQLRVLRDRPELGFVGSVNDRGEVDPFTVPPATMAPLWGRRLSEELRRLGR